MKNIPVIRNRLLKFIIINKFNNFEKNLRLKKEAGYFIQW